MNLKGENRNSIQESIIVQEETKAKQSTVPRSSFSNVQSSDQMKAISCLKEFVTVCSLSFKIIGMLDSYLS